MSKNPPDWWARFFGGLGIVIGLCGLGLTYYNSRWQREAYEKSLEERVFVQLSAAYSMSNQPHSRAGGEVAVGVVNLSLQPIYLKSVSAQFGEQRASFYEHDPLDTKEPMRRLEPGEAASYKTYWQSGEYAEGASLLRYIYKEKGSATVEVETTKKRFSQSAQINRVTFATEVPLTSRDVEELLNVLPKSSRK